MKKLRFVSFIVLFSFLACSRNIALPAEDTTGFKPELRAYNFFVEGAVAGTLLRYPQVNMTGINISNRYFETNKQTWLQTYSDSTGPGSWQIRLMKVDLDQVTFPYTLKKGEGYITWVDSRVDNIIKNCPDCQGVDAGCVFNLSADNASTSITITGLRDDIIEGTFRGIAYLNYIGFVQGTDASKLHIFKDGRFRIHFTRATD